uniref:Uncharacterized protein n=1 Tax=Megaviridae environmental sample TaxID=1737588 RepID=A0A5J6VJK9_9VIRU|nr:MAG: hypothetical protein [Megaviridae environmental sample]
MDKNYIESILLRPNNDKNIFLWWSQEQQYVNICKDLVLKKNLSNEDNEYYLQNILTMRILHFNPIYYLDINNENNYYFIVVDILYNYWKNIVDTFILKKDRKDYIEYLLLNLEFLKKKYTLLNYFYNLTFEQYKHIRQIIESNMILEKYLVSMMNNENLIDL